MYDEQSQAQDKPILIIPAAGKSSRFPDMKPKWLLTHPSGELMIEKVMAKLDIDSYKDVYIVILKEHCEKYEADTILKQAFSDKKFKIVILDNPTDSSPQTVYECIKKSKIDGFIVVKDCDCMVSYVHNKNNRFVVGLNLKFKPKIQNLHEKSFILCDENKIVSEIIEKNIVSQQICVGVYAMHSQDLITVFDFLSKSMKKEMYFSDVVSELIDRNILFCAIDADEYEDYGTPQEWFSLAHQKNTYFFDIDGILLINTGKYGKKNWFNSLDPIWENVKTIQKISNQGHEIIFVTSRSEDALDMVKDFLKIQNINYKTIISSCLHSKRILINDFANTNPFPSCIAINIPRNEKIEPYLR